MRLFLVLPVLAVLFAPAVRAGDGEVSLPRYPSISPDGSTVAFSWKGDVWTVPAAGGKADRLTSHPFNDTQSAWSRDGKTIAFATDRTGSSNVFVVNPDGTGLRQVTKVDRPISLVEFGVDGAGRELLMLSGIVEPDEYRAARSYQVGLDGGELERVFDAFGTFAVVSADGTRVLFNRGGGAWSRRNYRGPDTRDVWLYDRAKKTYTRLTSWEGNDGKARWTGDNSFVFLSDRNDGTLNLYQLALGGDDKTATRLTQFSGQDIDDFDVSRDGKTLVFSSWDSLYTLDLTKPGADPAKLAIRAEDDAQDNTQLKSIDRSVSEAALSPDGKMMAFVTYGEIYVRGTEAKSPARRVTTSIAREREIAWSADGSKLYFVSDQDGTNGIYAATVKLTRGEVKKDIESLKKPAKEQPAHEEDEAEATTEPATQPATAPSSQPSTQPTTQPTEASRWPEAIVFEVAKVVVDPAENLRDPSPSPDGKLLAYRKGNGKLVIRNIKSGDEHVLVDGWSTGLEWRWSPDSRHVAYVGEDTNFNSDVWVVRTDGKTAPVNVTRHPGTDRSPRWSADGKILAFTSDRVNREYDVWMVYLDRDLESLTAQELDQYYKDASAAAKKREPLGAKKSPTTRPSRGAGEKPAARKPLDLDDAYLRLRRVTSLSGDEGRLELTPAGDKYIFSAQVGTERGLYTTDKDFGAPKRLGAPASVQGLSFDGSQVVIVNAGQGGVLKLPAGEVEMYDIAGRIEIDLAAQNEQKFREASRIIGTQFWDGNLNGLDWKALTDRYAALARKCRTSDEFDWVGAKFVGELNGSHLGINSPDPANPQSRPSGRLGIRSKRVADGYEVVSVLEEGPAGKGPMRLEAGDVITAIELQPFGKSDTLETALQGRIGMETIVTVRRKVNDEPREIKLLITPISYESFSSLCYRNWRRETAKQVSDWSNGKIGYIHIQGMDQGSLDLFERDLYAACDGKAGLIIDVRNNGGGWTADRLLSSITAPEHAYTVPRGAPAGSKGYPNDRLFIARYTLPINMLCNEKSFSNAEIISHAFKWLKRGTLVGQRTAGGVISTGADSLIDGTSVRVPFRGWFLPDGTPEENNGCYPDIVVVQTPEDESRDYDAQLKAAVDDLMKRVK